MSPKYTARGQGPFAIVDYDKYKRKLKRNPRKQMYWAVASEYGYQALEKMNFDEMIEAYKAIELRNEKIEEEVEKTKKGGS